MEVKHLGNTDFNLIIECFLEAFKNYFVKMPQDPNYYKQVWKAAGVRFNLSYGMFDDHKLVGFIINAIGKRQGEFIAYNSGTGVIPAYRGKRIVKTIYDYALPELMNIGITKCQLEVITKNDKATRAYEGIGFKKCKHYKCFKGMIAAETHQNYKLKKVAHKTFNWNTLPNQKLYSWDNQPESLKERNYNYYQVFVDNKIQSYFIMDIESGYIAQFEVLNDIPTKWNILFSAIQSINKEIRINNIDTSLEEKIKAVKFAGLTNTVDQYEMELCLNATHN